LRLLANATAAPAEESQKPQRTKDQRQVIAGNAPPARSTIEVLFLFGSHGENIFFFQRIKASRARTMGRFFILAVPAERSDAPVLKPKSTFRSDSSKNAEKQVGENVSHWHSHSIVINRASWKASKANLSLSRA